MMMSDELMLSIRKYTECWLRKKKMIFFCSILIVIFNNYFARFFLFVIVILFSFSAFFFFVFCDFFVLVLECAVLCFTDNDNCD